MLLATNFTDYKGRIDAFGQGLNELGYNQGSDVILEMRFAEGKQERLPELAAELVRLKVDAIVVGGTPAIRAARNATRTIPIIMASVGDPVAEGFVASLARPGGNITGRTILTPDLSAKQLQLLKEAAPRVSRVAVLLDPTLTHEVEGFKEAAAAANSFGITLLSVPLTRHDDLEPAFADMVRDRANGVFVFANTITASNRKQIAGFAIKHRLPTIYVSVADVEVGGLLSYGPLATDNYRRVAALVDKVLKGVKPADIPVEQPTKFALAVNQKTAKALGITIPNSILLRADKVIE